MQYVYKYERGVILRRIIYIGITNDLHRRHREHINEHRLFRQCRLYYIRVPSRRKAKQIESYLIRRHHPSLNISEKGAKPFTMLHMPFIWRRYKTN